jgi:GT2 family glycosyltransferase/glycosyltransferase involved in cell wall biosynthesis
MDESEVTRAVVREEASGFNPGRGAAHRARGSRRLESAFVKLTDALRRLLAPAPLDWSRGAGRPPAVRPAGVDVIVPIYGAADDLRRCLASVEAHTDLERHAVILVLDGPQDQAVEQIVAGFTAVRRDSVRVLRNDVRLGFVASVNRGMRASIADVVLLNSDTIVTERWLEKLIDAALSTGDAGTVTPLSNHATLCSVPRGFEENRLPSGFDPQSFATLVERVSARSVPRLPTGVGVCLYIRRALIDDIGVFDGHRFGLGYGEENDFCLRALARGWLNLADDATFIYHAGHRSFRASRKRLQRRAARTLQRLHPRYRATIAALMKDDPLAPVRQRIVDTLVPPRQGEGGLRIVHLVHGWPPFQQAGTELYASWLVQQQRARHHVAVYTRSAEPAREEGEAVELLDEGVRVRLVTNNFSSRDPFRRNALRDRRMERDFERFLREESPDLLHIHHLAGHAFSLAAVARRLGIPIVLSVQDWWFLCARVNLLDREGNRCRGPEPEKCAQCATLTRIVPAALTNRLLHGVRGSVALEALAAADAFVAGSEAIRDDYVRAGVLPPATPFHVIPYGIAFDPPARPHEAVRRPLRFGYVGSVGPHKGVHVAVEAMRGFDAGEATLHIWGDDTALPEYVRTLRERAGPSVVFEGGFREDEKGTVFASMDVLLVPSIGLESFGLAAREAMASGVPVIASAGAALSEMFAPGLCGDFFPVGNAAALHVLLRSLVDDPSIIDRWAAHLPRPKRIDVHAAEIAAVYESVLAARRA